MNESHADAGKFVSRTVGRCAGRDWLTQLRSDVTDDVSSE